MYGLIYKDFKVNFKNMLIMCGVFFYIHILEFATLLFGDDSTPQDEMPFLFTLLNLIVVITAFIVIDAFESMIYANDERKKWAYWVVSSEQGIKAQVGAKYIFTYIVSTIGMIATMSINAISMDIADNAYNVSGICTGLFFIQIFMKSVEIPFIMAFGSKRGNNVRSIIFLVIFLIIAVYLLFGDLSVFGSTDDMWEKFFELFDTEQSPKLIILISLLAISVMPLFYLSYRISCKVYMKGVESYDK